MKKILLLFLSFSILVVNTQTIQAKDEFSLSATNYIAPTKIYWQATQGAPLKPMLPKSIYKSVYYNGYYYSGTLYLLSSGPSPANDGATGYYGGYLYGGRATTARTLYIDE